MDAGNTDLGVYQGYTFIHIPRTGGTAIRRFFPAYDSDMRNTHFTYRDYLAHGVRGPFFAVMRDPCLRAVSAWCYLRSQTPAHEHYWKDTASRAILGAYPTLDAFVRDYTDIRLLPHFAPQVEWLKDTHGRLSRGRVALIPFTGIEQAIEELLGKPVTMAYDNASALRSDAALSVSLMTRLQQIYADDNEIFRGIATDENGE